MPAVCAGRPTCRSRPSRRGLGAGRSPPRPRSTPRPAALRVGFMGPTVGPAAGPCEPKSKRLASPFRGLGQWGIMRPRAPHSLQRMLLWPGCARPRSAPPIPRPSPAPSSSRTAACSTTRGSCRTRAQASSSGADEGLVKVAKDEPSAGPRGRGARQARRPDPVRGTRRW
jgi:hypothetical protein